MVKRGHFSLKTEGPIWTGIKETVPKKILKIFEVFKLRFLKEKNQDSLRLEFMSIIFAIFAKNVFAMFVRLKFWWKLAVKNTSRR